jgi:hypothetical protein
MKARNLFTILFLALNLVGAALPIGAEEPKHPAASPLPRAEVQTAVFKIEYADVYTLHRLIGPLSDYLSGSIRADSDSRTIVVVGYKELVAACTEAIKRLDVPPKRAKNIELTFYILVASKKQIGDCPPVIQSFCEQMKGIFKGFRLLETVTMRAREGSRQTMEGIIAPTEPAGDNMPYSLHFDSVQLLSDEKDPKPIIRINKLDFSATITTRKESKSDWGVGTRDVGFNANVDFREGQEVGLTTSSQGTPGESLCIVAKAKVLD